MAHTPQPACGTSPRGLLPCTPPAKGWPAAAASQRPRRDGGQAATRSPCPCSALHSWPSTFMSPPLSRPCSASCTRQSRATELVGAYAVRYAPEPAAQDMRLPCSKAGPGRAPAVSIWSQPGMELAGSNPHAGNRGCCCQAGAVAASSAAWPAVFLTALSPQASAGKGCAAAGDLAQGRVEPAPCTPKREGHVGRRKGLCCPACWAARAAHLHVGGPEREVVAQQLHDECAVLVALLSQRVQLGDGLVECLRSAASCGWQGLVAVCSSGQPLKKSR